MKIDSHNNGEVALVRVDEEFWEKMDSFTGGPATESKPVEESHAWKCGWRRSTAPHLLVLVDWGEDDKLLGLTFNGPLADKALETNDALEALHLGYAKRILDPIRIHSNPEAKNHEKYDVAEYGNLIAILEKANEDR